MRRVLAIGLIALAAVFAILYRVENSSEDHSYNAGATPPVYVHVTLGRQYEISTPGGVSTVIAHGGSLDQLNCSYTAAGGTSTQLLLVTPMGTDTRTTHAVATFVGPVTGAVRIECRALTKTFVDDADGVSSDAAGLFVVLCTIALSIGSWLLLSGMYRRRVERTASAPEPAHRAPASVDAAPMSPDGEPAQVDDRA